MNKDLLQTTEGTTALVHCGPFANIAHGTRSVVAQKMGLRLVDYVVNETGFASDLGFQKYMDLVMPSSGIKPSCAVFVTTVQSLRQQGDSDLQAGLLNLGKHLDIVTGFGIPVVIASNRFPSDTDQDLAPLIQFCQSRGTPQTLSEAFTRGGEGGVDFAQEVVELLRTQSNPSLATTYGPKSSILEKITAVAKKIYGASAVEMSSLANRKLSKGGTKSYPYALQKPSTPYPLTRSVWEPPLALPFPSSTSPGPRERFHRGHVGQHDADARPSREFTSAGDQSRPFRRDRWHGLADGVENIPYL